MAEKTATIKLESKIALANINSLYEMVNKAMSKKVSTIVIDAEDCDEIDFSGMQVLMSLVKTAEAKDIEISWENLPIVVYQAAADLDLSNSLGL